jgi:hypothetical protein
MNRVQTRKISLSLAILIGWLGLFSILRSFQTSSQKHLTEESVRESLTQVPGVQVPSEKSEREISVSTTTVNSQQFLPEVNFQDPTRDQFLVDYVQSKGHFFLCD